MEDLFGPIPKVKRRVMMHATDPCPNCNEESV